MAKPAHRTVRLDEELVKDAERHARVAHRSVAAQFEYWIRLGRGVEHNRSFSEDRIARFLAGAAPLDHLSLQEKVAAIHEIERAAQTPESRAEASGQLRNERQEAGLPSYSFDKRYPDQLICRYADGRVVAGHFEGSAFVEDQALESDLSPKPREPRRRAAA
jgi:ParD-like antitoxin of type II bacterial toxin-antitoxin system